MPKPRFERRGRGQYDEADLAKQLLSRNRDGIGDSNADRAVRRTRTQRTERVENARVTRAIASDIDSHWGAVPLERARQREVRPLEGSDGEKRKCISAVRPFVEAVFEGAARSLRVWLCGHGMSLPFVDPVLKHTRQRTLDAVRVRRRRPRQSGKVERAHQGGSMSTCGSIATRRKDIPPGLLL